MRGRFLRCKPTWRSLANFSTVISTKINKSRFRVKDTEYREYREIVENSNFYYT